MERSIIHLNVANFAVAVERSVDARLRDRPVIIAPEGQSRAVVYDMSEEAFGSGVRKGQALVRAQRACRDALVIPPHLDRYERAMRAFLTCVLPYSPLVEATDVQGHVFADTTGTERLFGLAMDIAWRIRKTARASLGLDPIWTVAPNRLVAKIASRIVKPTGECLVEAGDEQKFLEPLPVKLLPGLEPEDLARLREYRLATLGDVARWSLAQLATLFGTQARRLFDSVRGIDPSPVLPTGQQPKVVAEHEFGEDTQDAELLCSALQGLAEHAGRRLREQCLAARRLGVMLDHSDGIRVVRQAALAQPSANDFSLFSLARRILNQAWVRRVRIRHLRLICDQVTFPPAQLDLFELENPAQQRQDRLVSALDGIRSRFGKDAIYLGRSLAARGA